MDQAATEILDRLRSIEDGFAELTHPSGWMDLAVASRYSGLSRSTLLRLIRGGKLKASRTAGKFLIRKVWLDRFIMTGDNRRLTSVERTMLEEELS